mgnify:FL=1
MGIESSQYQQYQQSSPVSCQKFNFCAYFGIKTGTGISQYQSSNYHDHNKLKMLLERPNTLHIWSD